VAPGVAGLLLPPHPETSSVMEKAASTALTA
jgi:hypothetical protein